MLYTQQGTHLAALYQTFSDDQPGTASTKQLAMDNHVTFTVLNGRESGTRARLLTKLVDQQRTILGHSTTMTVNGQSEQVYVGRRHNQFVGVWQKRATLFSVAPAVAWGMIGVAILGLVALLALMARRHRYWTGHLAKMTSNLARIEAGGAPEPIILTPDSPFLAMGKQIESLHAATQTLQSQVEIRQATFGRLIDHLPLGVMLLDANRQVLLANSAMAELVGHPIQETKHDYFDDIKTYRLARMIEHTYRNQKTHHKELTMLNTQKSVDASVIALNRGTAELQVLVILYDVTYLRQVEQMQLDFVGNVSHELKTPVTAISGFAETLLAGAKDDPKTLDQFLQIIYDESSRLTQLITDILTLSRPDSGQAQAKAVNVLDLVNDALKSLKQPIAEKGLEVKTDVPKDLTITTVPAKFSQVVRNLLNNAVFYNRKDGVVTVTATADEKNLKLSVQDTGIGIAENDQERIFERFYRVDKARSRHNGGTGLGLAIVHDMVMQLGGEVTLASQVGVGSTFTVSLPLADLPRFYK
ncbi:Signal transduction histidine kinase [Lacticaseibacillus camelliae DSM 22697 = JCM 13995]|uniref:histidine kinase n=1 Tax=Lacticaseibacillus camelliae DSM 22697 = JCM 13995 TaxID=1423730 RepID=A0A0R2F359_9LACO|nr:Signal transduction histidine kinase [Lacticaseibacillus camelliae DSM 22697 = JCM 13995]